MNNRGRPPKRNVSAFFEQQQPAPTAPRGNGPNSPAPTNGPNSPAPTNVPNSPAPTNVPNSPAATNEYMPNSPAAMNVSAVPTVAPPTEEQSLNAFFEARQNANANLVNMKPKKGYIPGVAGLFAKNPLKRQMGQRNLIFGNAMANLRQRQAANAAKPAKPFWKRMFGLGFKNKSRKNRKNKSRKNRKSRKSRTRRS
jgi:hypothetical protein